jgi:hypothetical protein
VELNLYRDTVSPVQNLPTHVQAARGQVCSGRFSYQLGKITASCAVVLYMKLIKMQGEAMCVRLFLILQYSADCSENLHQTLSFEFSFVVFTVVFREVQGPSFTVERLKLYVGAVPDWNIDSGPLPSQVVSVVFPVPPTECYNSA